MATAFCKHVHTRLKKVKKKALQVKKHIATRARAGISVRKKCYKILVFCDVDGVGSMMKGHLVSSARFKRRASIARYSCWASIETGGDMG